MSSSDFKDLDHAFQKALALGEAERDVFLKALDQDNPALARRLRRLLDADASIDTIAGPIVESVKKLSDDNDDPWLGRTVGDWRITDRLGAGGMGAVFLAERADDQYAQTVAVKIMGAQLLDQNAAARFRTERQILANLNHPNIARLVDGGSTEESLPYLVMEYVDGDRIDDYCDGKNLSVEARLSLFSKLCLAVDYAHRNLVVHRDLKPSNMLVTEDGEPKLLDFGIAKLLETDDYELTMAQTGQGGRVMTPEYASPEQVRGEPVSVATDVYALGVLLFRLLTGRSPYGPSATTPREIESAILEVGPKKPSASITEHSSADGAMLTAGELSEKRAVSVDRLRKTLSGDLDTIILKCLQKEQERRYATARDLATDIGCYLENRPIHARADSWRYKAKKFAIRNVKPLSITGVVLASAIGLISYYTLQLASERDRATLAAAESKQVSDFLTDLFASSSPHTAKGEEITALDLLETGSQQINALDDQPRLQAALSRIMAGSFTAIGETERSIPMLQKAIDVQEVMEPRDEIAIAYALHDLAEALRQRGQLADAEAKMRKALAYRIANFGPDHGLVGYTHARLGVILQDDRRSEEALALQRQGLDIMIGFGHGENFAAVDIRGNMGNALASLGRYEEAEALLRKTVAMSEKVEGLMAPRTVIRRNNVGRVLNVLGDYQEAADIFADGIERGASIWPENYYIIDSMLYSRGAALRGLGRLAESLDHYERASEMVRLRLGEGHLNNASRRRGLGAALQALGHYDEAEKHLEYALQIAKDKENAYQVALSRLALVSLYVELGRGAAAEAIVRKALGGENGLNVYHQNRAQRLLGQALSLQKRFTEAEPLLLEALADKERATGFRPTSLLEELAAVAAHYRRSGDLEASRRYGQRIHNITNSDAMLSWYGALALREYALTLRAIGDPASEQVTARIEETLLKSLDSQDHRIKELRSLQTHPTP